jgi:hypothetical protein
MYDINVGSLNCNLQRCKHIVSVTQRAVTFAQRWGNAKDGNSQHPLLKECCVNVASKKQAKNPVYLWFDEPDNDDGQDCPSSS